MINLSNTNITKWNPTLADLVALKMADYGWVYTGNEHDDMERYNDILEAVEEAIKENKEK